MATAASIVRRAALVLAFAVAGIGAAAGVALVTGSVEYRAPDAPWTEPLPAYAVEKGYTRYRSDQGGFALAGRADRAFEARPPSARGPVVLDRRHSDKQPEDSRLDLTRYRYDDMHGFGRAFDPVRAAGIALRPERGLLDSDALAGASALFVNLVSGDRPGFRWSEVRAIESFVRHGGGLVLITDHSNCYFHGEMLAPLAEQLDFALPPVTATDRGPGHTLSPNTVSWLRVATTPGHPVTDGVRTIAMVTAGAVFPGAGHAVLASTSGNGWSDRWDPYRKPKSAGFTGDLKQGEDEPSAAVPVAIAGEHGAGRVVVARRPERLRCHLRRLRRHRAAVRKRHRLGRWAARCRWSFAGRPRSPPLAGPRSLCTAAAGFAFRTLQVQVQRVAAESGVAEHCTVDGDVRSRRLLVLPEAQRDDMAELITQAERVVALVDVEVEASRALLKLLGVQWRPGEAEGAQLRWREALPTPPHPVFEDVPDVESVASRVPRVEGELHVLASDGAGRPVVVRTQHGQTEVVLVLDADLLSNARMENERADPTQKTAEVQAAHRLAFALLGWLAEPH